MLKPSITVLHRLPNRIRFQLSESINNIEEFKKTMMEDKLVVLFRYNPLLNTLLIRFDSSKTNYKKIKFNLIVAISKDNYLKAVKFFEKEKDKAVTHLMLESGLLILAAGANKFFNKGSILQARVEKLAAGLTVGAVSIHGVSEIRRNGVFDPEVMSILYLINSILNKNYLASSAVTWIGTFGRHLLNLLHFSRDGKEYKVLKENIKDNSRPTYHVVISQNKNVTNVDDLIRNLFNRDNKKVSQFGSYVVLGSNSSEQDAHV